MADKDDFDDAVMERPAAVADHTLPRGDVDTDHATPSDDPPAPRWSAAVLNPARGILLAVAVSLLIWPLLVLLVWKV